MDYGATKNYIKKHKIKDISLYNYYLKSFFIEVLMENFDLIYVDAPFLHQYIKDLDISFFSSKTRTISFASESTGLYLEIPAYYDFRRRMMLHHYSKEGIKGIIYETPCIWRDSKIDNFTSLKWNQLEIEFLLDNKENKNADYMVEIVKKFSNTMIDVIDKLNKKFNKGISIVDYFPTHLLSNLISKYGKLPLKRILNLQALETNTFSIVNDVKMRTSFDTIFHFLPFTHRKENHTKLFAHFHNLSKIKPLVEFAFSTNYQEYLNELAIFHFSEKTFFSKLLQTNEIKQSFAIKIYLPRITMFLLSLIHISEVVKSEWPDDFIEFMKKHGTSIL